MVLVVVAVGPDMVGVGEELRVVLGELGFVFLVVLSRGCKSHNSSLPKPSFTLR